MWTSSRKEKSQNNKPEQNETNKQKKTTLQNTTPKSLVEMYEEQNMHSFLLTEIARANLLPAEMQNEIQSGIQGAGPFFPLI